MSERISQNRRKLEIFSLELLKEDHPDWSREKLLEEAVRDERMEWMVRNALAVEFGDKMYEVDQEHTTIESCYTQAKWILENIQAELLQNIDEYIDGKPLSEIKIHGVSVPCIMNKYEKTGIAFIEVLESLICWKNNEYKPDNFHQHYFMYDKLAWRSMM